MIARFLGCKVWELDTVAVHYQDEAAIILEAQFIARLNGAGKGNAGLSGAQTIALPEY